MNSDVNVAMKTSVEQKTNSQGEAFCEELVELESQANILREILLEVRMRLDGPSPQVESGRGVDTPCSFWGRIEETKNHVAESLKESIGIAAEIRDQFGSE